MKAVAPEHLGSGEQAYGPGTCDDLDAGANLELATQIAHMPFDRTLGQLEPFGDLARICAHVQQPQNIKLAVAQRLDQRWQGIVRQRFLPAPRRIEPP